ncbi:hypothetical protein QCA50_013652 [Cerrena zonata]|uniref:Uncharacterized protein n=1 Tax=Cerrena zonata TaxID=2478898 RepID=A0AAW0FWW7_9APHY
MGSQPPQPADPSDCIFLSAYKARYRVLRTIPLILATADPNDLPGDDPSEYGCSIPEDDAEETEVEVIIDPEYSKPRLHVDRIHGYSLSVRILALGRSPFIVEISKVYRCRRSYFARYIHQIELQPDQIIDAGNWTTDESRECVRTSEATLEAVTETSTTTSHKLPNTRSNGDVSMTHAEKGYPYSSSLRDTILNELRYIEKVWDFEFINECLLTMGFLLTP